RDASEARRGSSKGTLDPISRCGYVSAMAIKVRDLKAEAWALARTTTARPGERPDADPARLTAALTAFDHIVAAHPMDWHARLEIAHLLRRLGDTAGAAAVYRALGMHLARAAHPLPAII